MRSNPEGMLWKGSQLFAKYHTSVPVEGPDTLNIEGINEEFTQPGPDNTAWSLHKPDKNLPEHKTTKIRLHCAETQPQLHTCPFGSYVFTAH